MDFWTRLKEEIKKKNTTQEWISGKIEVPFGTFRKWLTRKTYPDIKEGVEIAKLLNTTAEYLVSGKDIEKFTDDELQLIHNYRQLNKWDQENILLAINAWLTKGKIK